MKRIFNLATALALLGAIQVSGQSVTYDFQDGTDQGFGTGFGNDASASFPIVNIGGSLRMEILDTAAFQQAGRETGNPGNPQYIAMSAAAIDETAYRLSYDWYVDTSLSPGNYGNFLQLGTYVNTGSGYYAQDFPAIKDAELNFAQLSSGNVFSGTVTETFSAKGFNMPIGESFFRFGFISNGDGTQAKVYYDNITIEPVPEPTSIALFAAAMPALWMARRRASRR